MTNKLENAIFQEKNKLPPPGEIIIVDGDASQLVVHVEAAAAANER